MDNTVSQRGNLGRNILIGLLVLVLLTTSVIVYLMVTGKQVPDMGGIFKSDKEHSILLEEFVLNLKSDYIGKDYLKIQLALMYTDNKQGDVLNSNESKIRDVVIKVLSEKTAEEMTGKENISKVKEELTSLVNKVLDDEIVKDVYFTDLVIQ